MPPGKTIILIHGGSGRIHKEPIPKEMEIAYTEKLSEAVASGYAVLKKGGRSRLP